MSSLIPPFVLVDRYEVTAEIGRGGHAIVYHARDRVLDREVAVKLLREDALSSDSLVRFKQEVQVTAQLEHAHILHVYDTGAYEGRPYIVMELASGRTLADRIEHEGQLPIADALQITRDVGLALAHAHSHGVVHRDVKPENILLGAGGAILADFGIARITAEDLMRRITSTGTTVGTVQYMSPEQLCAEPKIDARSDQYSLACVLYEMLAGVRPHNAATFEGLRLLRVTGQCVPVGAHRPSVPASVDDALAVALSPLAADRFRTMEELLAALGANASGEFTMSGGASAIRRSGGYGVVDGARVASGGAQAGMNARVQGGSGGRAAEGERTGAWAPAGAKPAGRWFGKRALLPGAGAIALVAAVLLVVKQGRGGVSEGVLDDGNVAVMLTGTARNALDTASLDGRVTRALRSELDLWSGVRVVDRLPSTDTAALSIEPQIGTAGDSVSIRLVLHRAGAAASPRVEALVSKADAAAPAPIVASLVRQALVTRANSGLTIAETPGLDAIPVRSFAALRAYVRGFAALRGGLLDSAAARFREAAAASAKPFAQAEFWAAQSGAWAEPRRTDRWKPSVDNAVGAGTLRGVDSLLSEALSAMSRAEFPSACDTYRAATVREPGSFVAWYGLGECNRLDPIVFTSAGEYRFRGSPWSALKGYGRAVETVPSSEMLAALFPTILRTTYAESGRARNGRGGTVPTEEFSAMPSLSHDTLAFLPIKRDAFATAPTPDTWIQATRRGRTIALDLTKRWTERWPMSPHAWFHRALALETAGLLISSDGEVAADVAFARAESGARTMLMRSQIAAGLVRLALRRGDMVAAAKTAQMAIHSIESGDPTVRVTLAPLAALIGNFAEARRLAVPDTAADPSLPSDVADSVLSFRISAVLGECEQLSARRDSLEDLLKRKLSSAEITTRRPLLLRSAYREAAPCLGFKPVSEFPPETLLDKVFVSLARSDTVAAREYLAILRRSRRGTTNSTVTWDAGFLEAWASLQLGDTLGARGQLDGATADLANMSVFTTTQCAQAAGLRRGLALLAQLTSGQDRSQNRAARWHSDLTVKREWH